MNNPRSPHSASVLIAGRRDDRQSYDTPQSMATQLTAVDDQRSYGAAILEDLLFVFDGQKLQVLDGNDADVSRYDAIFMMGWFKDKMLEDEALSLAAYAEFHHIPYRNPEVGVARSNSKLSQCVMAALLGIQITPFVFAQNGQRLLEGVQRSSLGFPLILKSVRASRGNDNYLVSSLEQLTTIVGERPEIPFIAQMFVPNDGDYRILVMGDKVRFVMHRLAQGDSHLNNTSQGGVATEIPLEAISPKMLEEAVMIAKRLRRAVTGVDMIVHKETGQHYFLEANNMPQLSTGSLVDKKMRALSDYFDEWLESEKV